MSGDPSTLGLVMGGGGARASYQVGFLSCLARRFPQLEIPILTGVSAGAINTAFLAGHPGPFEKSVEDLTALWSNLTTDQVIASGTGSFLRNVLRWSARLIGGGSKLAPPTRGMVDTRPLADFLRRNLEVGPDGRLLGVARNIERGRLTSVAVTTTDYATGQSVTFVEGRNPPMWRRPTRRSVSAPLTVDHVLASAALPLFFPAVRVGNSWHGDGGVRLTAPLSPALHLGAGRILAISTRYQKTVDEADQPATHGYPPPAQVLGVLMNAIFLDMLDFDALNLGRINELLERLPEDQRGGLRPAKLLLMRPSQDLAKLATRYEARLPGPLRFLTRGLGTRETKSPDSLSMILFEPDYMTHMMRIGVEDAERRLGEIEAFLTGAELPRLQHTGFWHI
ncbi:MAG TPA: patatin-like phospholipase family protein [Planctomycetota bacterium]|nr:patatin-like phospholipase family protein [Planctomycetota bacterium]